MAETSLSGWDPTSLAVAEFTALRAEIVQLTGLQSQIVTLTVVAFGAIVPVGLQNNNAAIVLVYPLLSLILGIVWLYKAHLITRIAAYLRSGVEDRVGQSNLGWEHFVQQHPLPRGRFAYWGLRSIFPTTSLLAIGASIHVAKPSIALLVLYGLAFMVTVASVVVFILWREPAPEVKPRRPRTQRGKVTDPSDNRLPAPGSRQQAADAGQLGAQS
ncbi:hypothetical protein [Nonomuraea bangladeshensis]|uniref:hypothetical protein n=1 Tax=Nonomuraea bangladeshensis TaxID=404385 RepID=UPI003C2B89A5